MVVQLIEALVRLIRWDEPYDYEVDDPFVVEAVTDPAPSRIAA